MQAETEALKALRSHWAVMAIDSGEELMRRTMAAYAEAHGEWPALDDETAHGVLALARAYDDAARDAFVKRGVVGGADVLLRALDEQIAAAASRAFLLYAALPAPTGAESRCLRSLQLCALASAGEAWLKFDDWWSRHGPEPVADDGPWHLVVLYRLTSLWRQLLAPAGERDLQAATEIVAWLRESREAGERALFDSLGEPELTRMRFFLFALYHLADAATDLLLAFRRGWTDELPQSLQLHFVTAHVATSDDLELGNVLTWLHIAGLHAYRRESQQLDLPGLSA